MKVCAQCHHPVAQNAATCGWCGKTVHQQTTNSMDFWKSGLSFPMQDAGESESVTQAASSCSVDSLVSPYAAKQGQHDYAQNIAHSDIPIFQTATLAPPSTIRSAMSRSSEINAQYPPTEAMSSWLNTSAITPVSMPPPPPFLTRSVRFNAFIRNLWALVLAPICTMYVLRQERYWSDIILTTSKSWYIIAIIAFVITLASIPKTFSWKAWLPPIMTIVAFLVMGGIFVSASVPVAVLQAQQAEQSGNYKLAISIYQQLNSAKDIARLRLAEGTDLTNSQQFADALADLSFAQQQGTVSIQQQANSALGTLYWKWGHFAYEQHNLDLAQQYWQRAISIAPESTGATLAKTALATPLDVKGRIVWLGAPVPGLQVSLVSQWSYSQDLQLLQTGGQRLQAVTGSDGSFTIANAQPGIAYALVWEGSFGDTTALTPDGHPVYTITLQPLQNGDLGNISIQG